MIPLKELITVDAASGVPLYIQVANAFVHNIRSGRLRKGLKLPGSREVAALLGINRMTMVAAYDELQVQGWIQMVPRKGTFVSYDMPDLKPRRLGTPGSLPRPEKSPLPIGRKKIVAFPPSAFPDTSRLIINDGFPDTRLAPVEAFMRNMRRLANMGSQQKYLLYGGATGTPLLRETLADVLNDTRGLAVTADNILITRGAQMGIYLTASVLLTPGDHVIVAEPGYFGASLAFQQLGAKINRVPVDQEGMDIDAVSRLCRKKKVRLVYAIPHHHHPTTVTLTPERRIRLLELSAKYGFAIIEDDYDYDFHYASRPMLPMASLDRRGNIIYVGTFTKTLAPAFRVGFMVATEDFIRMAAHLRRTVDWQGDSLAENAIAEMFKDGTIARHIKKSVRLYRERRDHFCSLLQSLGDAISFNVPDGGMSVWATFNYTAVTAVSHNAARKGLSMGDGTEYNTPTQRYNAVRMGFASLNHDEQERAISILRACL